MPRNAIKATELEEVTDEPKEVWFERIWTTLSEKNYLWATSGGNHGNTSKLGSTIHIPKEFPDTELGAEPYETRDGCCTACRPNGEQVTWRYKPIEAYPVGYREPCAICIATFVSWWNRKGRFEEVTGRDR